MDAAAAERPPRLGQRDALQPPNPRDQFLQLRLVGDEVPEGGEEASQFGSVMWFSPAPPDLHREVALGA